MLRGLGAEPAVVAANTGVTADGDELVTVVAVVVPLKLLALKLAKPPIIAVW
jgi:hypothetical protein